MLALNFNPFPFIETERLNLRQLTAADAESMYVMRTDKKVTEFTHISIPANIGDAAAYVERVLGMEQRSESVMWGIVLKAEQKLIGTICYWHIDNENLRAEIGYILHSAYHKLGLMQEAIAKVIPYGFEVIKLHAIEAHIDPANIPSKKLLERNHFVQEGYFKDRYFDDGNFTDEAVYTLINH